MREFKVDPKTGKVLYKVQPEGLPALWIEDGLCERCKEFGKCLEVKDLTEEEWLEFKATLVKEETKEPAASLCSV